MNPQRHRRAEVAAVLGGFLVWAFQYYWILVFAGFGSAPIPTTAARHWILLGVWSAGLAAMAAHKWAPWAVRPAHWILIGFTVLLLGTCFEPVLNDYWKYTAATFGYGPVD